MEGLSYRPLIENMTWSYSRIECFNDCPYRWFLKYIKKYEDTPQFYSSYGSFMHKLIEGFYKGELSKEEMQIKFLFDFKKEVKGVRPSADTVQKYIQAGRNYLENFTPFPFNVAGVEKEVRFKIDNMPFIGFIDFLGEKDGEYYIIDHKSRDLKPRSKRQSPTLNDHELDKKLRQLYLYGAAVKQENGKFPKALCFNCFKNGVFITEPFNKTAYDEAVSWAKNSIEEIKDAEDFHPLIDYFKCRFICGVNNECCYWQGQGGD